MSSLLTKILTNQNFVNLESCIAAIPDPRRQSQIDYSLKTIIIIAVCAIIGGADDFTAIEKFGWDHCDYFEKLLNLNTNIPSHDTFNDVFNRLIPRAFYEWISLWLADVIESLDLTETIRIDGKMITSLSAKDPLNFVRAWSDQIKMVVEKVKVKKGSNEIATIPDVLDKIDLDGKVVTIDAIGTQKNIADQICAKNGDYVFALKKNQPQLYEDVSLYLKDVVEGQIIDLSMDYYKAIDSNHGRIEVRECWIVSNISWLHNRHRWRKLRSIVLIKTSIRRKGSLIETSRFYISSKITSAKNMLGYVRGHWSIENQLHWQLDVNFCEDVSMVKDIYGIQNLTTIKDVALSLLLQNEMKLSIKNKRARAAANFTYLLEVLLNQSF